MKKLSLKHLFEYALVAFLYAICKLFPMDWTSSFFGGLMGFFGPKMKVNKRIRRNIEKAFPEYDAAQIEGVIKGMWENLGRYVGEFPHLGNLTGEKFWERVKLEGTEHIDKAIREGRGIIMLAGHFSNWEIMPKAALEYGMPLILVYRPPNNRLVNDFILKARLKSHVGMFAKGKESTRQLVKVLGRKGHAGLLADQKTNEGLCLKFFGRDAMTTPGPAQLALKFGCDLIPAVVFRDGSRFTVKVLPAIEYQNTGDEQSDIKIIMQKVNDIFEIWIRERPEQWLWLHRRWVEN